MEWSDLRAQTREIMLFLGDFSPTIEADERTLKGCMLDDETGGGTKTYLDSKNLRAIAEACNDVADWLDQRAEMKVGA